MSALLIACGGPTVSMDGGVGSDSAIDGSANDAATGTRGAGTVSLTQTAAGHSLSADFLPSFSIEDLRRGVLTPLCNVVMESGACRAYECPAPDGFQPAGTLTAFVNGTQVGSISPSARGDYLSFEANRVFDAGDSIRFALSGDVVPAFEATVLAPARETATLPTSIDRSSPQVITWTTASTPELAQIVVTSGTRVVACVSNGADGSITVSPTVLGTLDATATGLYAVTVFNTTVVSVGDWDVLANAAEGIASGTIPIQ